MTPQVQQRMLEIAREFRKELQPSEAILWNALRNRRLRRFKFRRQQPIGAFVVDFYCDEAALVVEVDGPIHAFQQKADSERQEMLESLDLRVVRVPAHDFTSDLDRVLSLISTNLPDGPLPSPVGRGAGGEG